jgi:hypothetical protein
VTFGKSDLIRGGIIILHTDWLLYLQQCTDLYLCFPEQSCSEDEDDNGEAEGKVANQCVV